MKAKFLLPPLFRLIGWTLAIPGFVLGYFCNYYDYKIPRFGLKLRNEDRLFTPSFENFTNELALMLMVTGLLFIAFARLKREDELTARIRLNALYWGILINYVAYGIFIGLSALNGVLKSTMLGNILSPLADNLNVLVYNLFMPLVIFIGRFYYLLYKSKNEYELKPLGFLPYKPYHTIGKILSLVLLVVCFGSEFIFDYKTGENLILILPLVMLVWVYSRQKQEDEYINSIRLDAMQLAVYINYAVLLISNLFMFGIGFLYVLYFNLVTIPVIFVTVFHYRLYKLSRENGSKHDLNLGIL